MILICLMNYLVALGFADSKIATGTEQLLTDVGKWLQFPIAPSVGLMVGVYFLIRRSAADDNEKKIWEKRAVGVVVCVIIAEIFGEILKVVGGYYQ